MFELHCVVRPDSLPGSVEFVTLHNASYIYCGLSLCDVHYIQIKNWTGTLGWDTDTALEGAIQEQAEKTKKHFGGRIP